MIDTREEVEHLFVDLYLPVMVGVGVVVWALVGFALLRYRAGRRRATSRKSDAKVVESLYAFALAGAAAVLVTFTFVTEDRVDALAASPGARVHIVAFKWQWRVTYPREEVPALVGTRNHVPTMVVPTQTTVRFSLTSRDVIHALWIPELRFKRDAFPGMTTEFDLVFARPGVFTGRCAEFCGRDHADMILRVRAVPAAQYRAWVDARG